MFKSTKKLRLILLFALTATIASSALPLQAFVRQNVPPQSFSTSTKLVARWGSIFSLLRRKKGRRGSRGDHEQSVNLCMLTPGRLGDDPDKVPKEERLRGTVKIWDHQPLFVWQGEMGGIKVIETRSQKEVWRKSVEPGTNTLLYDGEPLEPGKDYSWLDSTRSLEELPTKVTFRPMREEKRDEITAALEELETKAQGEGKTELDIADERINYFIEKELWSDALKEMHLISNPSEEILEQIESIKDIENNSLCQANS